ncbi:c-type cytochrome [Nannocystis sp. SCPEA4]|uniref:c-type cytochrome n=1 Tax=Nannocystis sp. SCPEA4 TaxID=2996787 RepID=UPI00226E11F9|nr:c-type cytochrome [Nannocystis sp. SCPEA4]MCY1057674.1 c-type cytochrome [Nannocystis sp. SCPEA4]
MNYLRLLAVCSLVLSSCQDTVDLDPLDESPVVESTVRPPPILGGTLTLTDDGMAIAADPDRDLIHIVDLDAREVRHTIALTPGDQPHRIALGSDGRAHVVLRGSGSIATIDPVAGTVAARHAVCPEPRGIAFHDVDSSLYVACAGGSLLHLTEGGAVLERRELEPDLRDVIIVGDEVKVSLFRSATILGLDGSRIEVPSATDFIPHVAWRTWVTESGEIAMLHQVASTAEVPIDPEPGDLPEGGSPYGGGSSCDLGLVAAAITTFSADASTTTPLLGSNLTVDAAFSSDGWVAMAVPGATRPEDRVESKRRGRETLDFGPVSPRASTVRVDRPDQPTCGSFDENDYGQVTAVAYAPGGGLIMQSREPAQILVMDSGPGGPFDTIPLKGEARFDTGHEIFHRATDSGLSCASCHPEGTDDGHVWDFADLGPRRTQALDVGLADTAPYHWDGDMADFDVLMAEVLAHRMGGKRQSPERGESFTRWMFEQQRPSVAVGIDDPTLAAAGEGLFVSYGCATCHDGPAFGGQRTERIAGVAKQVPSLRRISLHPPYMHDGRAQTLEAAIRDMIATTRPTAAPDSDVDAIAAYLRQL